MARHVGYIDPLKGAHSTMPAEDVMGDLVATLIVGELAVTRK
ncbi:MAG TPA: hypothetical protein VGI36_17270 [Candidatus Binataceae bacterium]